MRRPCFVLLVGAVLAACGSGGGSPNDGAVSDAPGGNDGPRPDAAVATCTPVKGTNIALVEVADVGGDPVLVTSPPGDPRLFVVLKGGQIRIIADGKALKTPFLDISNATGAPGPVRAGGEAGLLGLAFHPEYSSNGRFFVYYTGAGIEGKKFSDVVAEYKVSSDPNVADEASGRALFAIPDPESNHNGGMIEFGPDGKLWISTGDGGVQRDPAGHAQRDDILLGKILRLDIAAAQPRPEIWAKGLRNPWRWSFDSKTGELYIGDVGDQAIEEVNVIPWTQTNVNFGWSFFEGTETGFPPTMPPRDPPQNPLPPVVEHGRDEDTGEWKSVIGGQVYRGSCFPDIQGWYFYTDHFQDNLWTFRWENGEAKDDRKLSVADYPTFVSSIHADALGELYVTSLNGTIHRIVAKP